MDKRNDSGGVRTDSEMWMECYYGLKAVGDDALDGGGLCWMLTDYHLSDVIDRTQWVRMKRQLQATCDPYGCEGYYWPAGKAAPRIKACLMLAKLTEGK